MADTETKDYENDLALARISKLFARAQGQKWPLEKLTRLFDLGYQVSASQPLLADIMTKYMEDPEDWNFGLQEKSLLCKALNLPEEAVNSSLTTVEILDLMANLQLVGSDDKRVMQDPDIWKRLGPGGKRGSAVVDQIIAEAWGEQTGVPKEYARKMTPKQLGDGLAGLQFYGIEEATTQEAFWRDILNSAGGKPSPALLKKWAKIVEKQRAERAEDEAREQRRKGLEWLKKYEKYKKERAELDLLRAEDRRKRLLRGKRKKAARRRRRQKRLRDERLENLGIVTQRRITTPWGNNFIFVGYKDDTSEIYRIESNGELKKVQERAEHAYSVSEADAGMLHVVPVIGRRRSSPVDSDVGKGRGPVGMAP